MPANTGTPPPHERVDIRLANGWIARNRDSRKYDWRLGKDCAGMPIASWQPSNG